MSRQEADKGVNMIDFISDNFLLCITTVYVLLGMVMSIKLRRADSKSINKYGKTFMEIPIQIRHKILFNGKWIKALYFVTVILIYAVALFRLNKYFYAVVSAFLALPVSFLLALSFFELTLFISAFLRRLISINNASLNVMFSTVIFIISALCINVIVKESLSFEAFLLSQVCLGCCYIMMLFILMLVLQEANSKNSTLTFRNIWKSAFLTILLFMFVLALMSDCCMLYNANTFYGAEYGLFDMLYYTVITFATVGYGDIVPNTMAAKVISMLTVFTSILCITVLLSEIAGIKKSDND